MFFPAAFDVVRAPGMCAYSRGYVPNNVIAGVPTKPLIDFCFSDNIPNERSLIHPSDFRQTSPMVHVDKLASLCRCLDGGHELQINPDVQGKDKRDCRKLDVSLWCG